jgi:hypothetical protein
LPEGGATKEFHHLHQGMKANGRDFFEKVSKISKGDKLYLQLL